MIANGMLRRLALAVSLVAACVAVGCDGKFTDTVWITEADYHEFRHDTGISPMNDGEVYAENIRPGEFEKYFPELADGKGGREWVEEDVRRWLFSNGAGIDDAARYSEWASRRTHCFLAVRRVDRICLFLK